MAKFSQLASKRVAKRYISGVRSTVCHWTDDVTPRVACRPLIHANSPIFKLSSALHETNLKSDSKRAFICAVYMEQMKCSRNTQNWFHFTKCKILCEKNERVQNGPSWNLWFTILQKNAGCINVCTPSTSIPIGWKRSAQFDFFYDPLHSKNGSSQAYIRKGTLLTIQSLISKKDFLKYGYSCVSAKQRTINTDLKWTFKANEWGVLLKS